MTPRITVAMLVYNQAEMVDEAVHAALGQIGEPVEILLSDDASSDGSFVRLQAAAAAYRGPHAVVVRRNGVNLGIGAHLNAVVQAARGELIVMMAGDDVSLPDRVAATAAAWDAADHRPDLIACHLVDMDADGRDHGVIRVDDLSHWKTVDDWARRRPYIVGAGHAFTRRLFERFGPLLAGVSYEDQANLLRALCRGGAVTIDRALVRYRRGGVSDRLRRSTTAEYVARTQRRNASHLALHAQWLADARLAGCFDAVDAATRREHDRELFLHALLAADSWSGRLRATLSARDVAAAWRWRKLIYWQWPALAVALQRLRG